MEGAADVYRAPRRASNADYRADIDGLRGIAVLSVVLHHWGVPLFAGGQAGVDVFFVISGFLITRILYSEMQAGTFSVRAFYARRILRIFPALVAMVLVTAIGAWLLLAPSDLHRFGHSAAATALFGSNFYFLGQGGYYAASAQQFPLLHMWSLSVEEQFYMLFPLLLLAVGVRTKAKLRALLAAMAAVSFALALWLELRSPAAAFYFSGSRAWELLAGAVLAVTPGIARSRRREAAGWLGLALIVFAVTGLAPIAAPWVPLAACAGAALVIVGGTNNDGIASRALAVRPLVFIGLISYSLYLWHWPLLVLFRATYPVHRELDVLVVAATFVIAVVSWRLVEQPFRQVRPFASQREFTYALTSTAVIAVAATLLSSSWDGADRLPERARWFYSFDAYETRALTRQDRCFLTPGRIDIHNLDYDACLPRVAGKATFLLAGDSHAAHLWSGLARALPEVTVQQATASGCRPLLLDVGSFNCKAFVDQLLMNFVPQSKPDAVVLAARWRETDLPALRHSVEVLRGTVKKVIVIGPAPQYRHPLPRLLAWAERTGNNDVISRMRKQETAELDMRMERALAGSGAEYVSIHRALCAPSSADCETVTPEQVPLQFDYGHFTGEGAEYLAKRLHAQLLDE